MRFPGSEVIGGDFFLSACVCMLQVFSLGAGSDGGGERELKGGSKRRNGEEPHNPCVLSVKEEGVTFRSYVSVSLPFLPIAHVLSASLVKYIPCSCSCRRSGAKQRNCEDIGRVLRCCAFEFLCVCFCLTECVCVCVSE